MGIDNYHTSLEPSGTSDFTGCDSYLTRMKPLKGHVWGWGHIPLSLPCPLLGAIQDPSLSRQNRNKISSLSKIK